MPFFLHTYSKLDRSTSNLQPTNLQQAIDVRPPTAKPKDPDQFNFQDERMAKDYRKMWDKYQEMEAMLMAKSQNDDPKEEEEEADE